jgi:hypothetical protein
MAIFNCTLGNFAVVRWCQVNQYATDIEVTDPVIKRTAVEFEKERRKGTDVIKYDVIPFEWIDCGGKREAFKKLPPYMYPDFSKMSWPPPSDLKKYRMVDAAFFS